MKEEEIDQLWHDAPELKERVLAMRSVETPLGLKARLKAIDTKPQYVNVRGLIAVFACIALLILTSPVKKQTLMTTDDAEISSYMAELLTGLEDEQMFLDEVI